MRAVTAARIYFLRRPMTSRLRSGLIQDRHRHEKGHAMKQIVTFLWFDTEGEEAAKYYTSIFPNSKITDVTHYGSAGPRPEGTVMTVEFELDGMTFVALNGGPDFKFNEAISFQVPCESQEEVDGFWNTLSEGGEEGPCGWLKDKYGVSWQITPTRLPELLSDPDKDKAQRVMAAMLEMKKIEIDELEKAAAAA
jgi:predicted 3-demethylubiquinone-9 3-methyltransferase (glyoxalase superfamily)